ncbi:MAG TPA: hypothetical protein ACFYEK_06170 [Candidatus Wunengus sp. YC60]|uniref:hypothetical protein n=1 Tax=Candidatus Wunengus sp. YC60 TaxID=3367697 RepID=UPI004025E176
MDKPIRFFINTEQLPGEVTGKLVAMGKQLLTRFDLMREAGMVGDVWTQRTNEGIVFKLDKSGDVDNVKIFMPIKEKEQEKEEKEKVEVLEDWVILLSITNENWNLLGVLVIDQTFNIIKYIKSDGSENFAGFANWNRYYDFKSEWGSASSGGKFELEELERRSEIGMAYSDSDKSTYDYAASFTQLQPGLWGTVYPDSSPYSFIIPGIYGPNLGGGYWLPHDDGSTTWYTFWDTAVAVDDWPWDNSWWSILNYHYQTKDSEGDIIDDGYVYEAFIWPSGGIQTDTQVRNWNVHDEYYFKSTDNEQSNILFTYNYNKEAKWVSRKEDCWSGNSETIVTLVATQDNWIEGTATCKNPVDCLTNNVFNPFSKWFIYHEGECEKNISKTHIPWTYEWTYEFSYNVPDMPGVDEEYTYFIKIDFDDGHEEVINDNYIDGWYEYNDYAIYNFGSSPIYIGNLVYVDGIWNEEYSDYGYCHQLFYYFNEKFKISEQSTPANGEHANIFNCFEKYGGYWDGQLRVGKLKITRKVK